MVQYTSTRMVLTLTLSVVLQIVSSTLHMTTLFFNCENCSDLESFGVYIRFSGNSAPSTGRMVSGSSLSTCPWAFGVLSQSRNPEKSLIEILSGKYSRVFSFDEVPDDPTLVRSAAANLDIEQLDSSGSNITKVFP